MDANQSEQCTEVTKATAESTSGLKRFIWLALALFGALVVAGYLKGTQDRLSDDNLRYIILSNLKIESRAGVINYRFPASNPFWTYEENNLHGSFNLEAFAKVAANPLLNLPGTENGTVSTLLLGAVGSTVMTSMRTAFEKPSRETVIGGVVVVVGSAVGWIIGWELGHNRPVELTHPEIKRMLQDSNFLAWLKANIRANPSS